MSLEAIIGESALVIALLGMTWALISGQKHRRESQRMDIEYRAEIREEVAQLFEQVTNLRDKEVENLDRRLTRLLELTPSIDKLVEKAEEANIIEKAGRRDQRRRAPRAPFTEGHQRYGSEGLGEVESS